jgi:multidrug efflux pump subunit AcrA (membrane-fusion protein)
VSRFPEALRRALGGRRRWLGLLAAVVALGGGGWAYATRGGAPDTVRVRREDLALGIDVDGELVSTVSMDIGPPVVREMWEFKISFLAPESATVKKGEPLVRFDSSALERQLEEKRAEYEEAAKRIERKEVELLGQRRDLELQLAEAESSLEKARLKNDVPEELRARNEVLQTALELKNAEQEKQNLTARIAAVRASQDASLRGLISQRDRAKARVAELMAAIQAMTVNATQDGIVIYRTGWRDEKKKIGDTVWFGEKLLQLPDLAQMRADGDVDEADGGAVVVGQRVSLRLEALPDKDFAGKLVKIASAVRRKSWRVPNKVFRVQIALDKSDAALRPAMRFRGEIQTQRVRGVLTLPREAVFQRPSGPVCWERGMTGFHEVQLKLGRHNKSLVEVLQGLGEGSEVSTTDLLAESGP